MVKSGDVEFVEYYFTYKYLMEDEEEIMKIYILSESYYSNSVATILVDYLKDSEIDLANASLYYEFPIIREI